MRTRPHESYLLRHKDRKITKYQDCTESIKFRFICSIMGNLDDVEKFLIDLVKTSKFSVNNTQVRIWKLRGNDHGLEKEIKKTVKVPSCAAIINFSVNPGTSLRLVTTDQIGEDIIGDKLLFIDSLTENTVQDGQKVLFNSPVYALDEKGESLIKEMWIKYTQDDIQSVQAMKRIKTLCKKELLGFKKNPIQFKMGRFKNERGELLIIERQ